MKTLGICSAGEFGSELCAATRWPACVRRIFYVSDGEFIIPNFRFSFFSGKKRRRPTECNELKFHECVERRQDEILETLLTDNHNRPTWKMSHANGASANSPTPDATNAFVECVQILMYSLTLNAPLLCSVCKTIENLAIVIYSRINSIIEFYHIECVILAYSSVRKIVN